MIIMIMKCFTDNDDDDNYNNYNNNLIIAIHMTSFTIFSYIYFTSP